MCFDAKTSALSFIIGTLFNIIGLLYYRNKKYIAIALVWQYVLLMQIADFIAWKNPTCGTAQNKFALSLAYVANITQPLVLYLSLLYISDVDSNANLAAGLLLFAYMVQISLNSISTFGNDTNKCLKPSEGCNHLNYYWWKGNGSGSIYFLTIVSLVILMLKPLSFALLEVGYITIALIMSSFIYKCGVPSIWCWFTAFGPVMNLFLFGRMK